MAGADLWGLKIGGAGGGGFLLAIFEDEQKRDFYDRKIKQDFADCLVYKPIFGGKGMVLEQADKKYQIGRIEKI